MEKETRQSRKAKSRHVKNKDKGFNLSSVNDKINIRKKAVKASCKLDLNKNPKTYTKQKDTKPEATPTAGMLFTAGGVK